MENYEENAEKWAEKVGLQMKTDYKGHYQRLSELVTANFTVTLSRKGHEYTFDFSKSYNESWTNKNPSLYSILACLTKQDPGTFSNFCSDYGYSDDSISALNVYKNVCDEWKNVSRLFGDVLPDLQEIQ